MESDLPGGLYEALVSGELRRRLDAVEERLVTRGVLRSADAADRIARYAAAQVERALDAVPEAERVSVGVDIIRRILGELAVVVPRIEASSDALASGEVLHAIGEYLPDGSVRSPARPLIPLLDTTPAVEQLVSRQP